MTRDEHMRAEGAINALDAVTPEIIRLRSDYAALAASHGKLVEALRSASSTAHYRGTLRNGSDFCQGTFDECTNCTNWKTTLVEAEKLTKEIYP